MALIATFFIAQGIQFGFLSTRDGMSMLGSSSLYFVILYFLGALPLCKIFNYVGGY